MRTRIAIAGLGILSLVALACVSLPPPVPMLPEPGEHGLFGSSVGNVGAKKEAVVTSAATGEVRFKDSWHGYSAGNPALIDPRLWISGAMSDSTLGVLHLSWLTAGFQGHYAPQGFAGPWPWLLGLGLQIANPMVAVRPAFAYELRAGASLHPRPASFVQFALGASASAGTRRWNFPVHGVLRQDYADNIWGSELRLARPEARAEGLLGVTFFLGDRVRAGLAAQPFYIFAAGSASMECYLCSQKDVRLVSFRTDKGIALQLSLSLAKQRSR